MRVLLVSARGADRAFGGAERYVEMLGAGLGRRGHEVTVLAAYPARSDASPRRVTRHRSDPLRQPARRLRDRLDGFVAGIPDDLEEVLDGVDLVHTNNLPGIGTGLWELARRRGLPVVHTLHDYGLLCARSSLRRRDAAPCPPQPALCGLRRRRLSRWAPGVTAVIAVSRHVLSRHAGVFAASTATTVIALPRSETGDPTAGPPSALRRLGYVGALTREKGVDGLMSCASALADRGVSLSVAGSGPLEGLVRASPVTYVGHLDDAGLSRFLRDHDAGVVCSVWEEPAATFAALDWLGARRPVIASRVGALGELAAEAGVMSYDGGAAGLLAAVDEASTTRRWRSLIAPLSEPAAGHDVDRWLDAHLRVYARAVDGVAVSS